MYLKRCKILLSLLTASLMAACQTGQHTALPQVAIDSQYPHNQSTQLKMTSWRYYLNNTELEQVINLAISNNKDLKESALRIREAQALYGIQKADLYPSINAEAGLNRGRTPADLSYTGREVTASEYQVGLGLSQWELDLWGRIRSLNESALQTFFNAQWNRLAVQNSIIEQVASTYINLAELEKRIAFASASVTSYKESVRISKRRYEVGASSKVEYMQSLTLLTDGQTLLEQLQQARDLAHNYLVQLVGEPITVHVPALDSVAFKTIDIEAGLPSELLLNRPDIRAAEAELYAKRANIHAARAAFFPTIALTASFGTASADLDGLFKSGSRSWSFAPSISLPIFNAGRLKNNLQLAEVRQEIAVAQYEKTVQNAFKEVADALTDKQSLERQLEIQGGGLMAFRENARLAQLRYDSGTVNYLEVLDAERSLLSAEQEWIQTQSELLQSYVSLYFALGGDAQSTAQS